MTNEYTFSEDDRASSLPRTYNNDVRTSIRPAKARMASSALRISLFCCLLVLIQIISSVCGYSGAHSRRIKAIVNLCDIFAFMAGNVCQHRLPATTAWLNEAQQPLVDTDEEFQLSKRRFESQRSAMTTCCENVSGQNVKQGKSQCALDSELGTGAAFGTCL